jgi:hypothetical protein
MGVVMCVLVAASEEVRNIVSAGLKDLGVEARLLDSLDDLPPTLEKSPRVWNPAGSNHLDKSIAARPKKRYRNWLNSIPLANSSWPARQF